MAYSLRLRLQGLPRTINAGGRSHWAVKMKETQHWKTLIWTETMKLRPPKPLKRAKIKYTRFSSVPCDYDGLVSSFKHIQDALIFAKIIEDDSMAHIGAPVYAWEKGKQRGGYITVEVDEVTDDLPNSDNS